MRRTMEFILEQQAQFAANIQTLQEERVRDVSRIKRLEESFQLLVQLAQSTDERLENLEAHMPALEKLETRMPTLEANMAALAAAQAHADERLSALIDIVRDQLN
ncbi:MAG: hypothetical protein JOZ52_13780 [Acidobacteria bacterium]|nr:hypothetical protein [Acidobacteriota bacterium]